MSKLTVRSPAFENEDLIPKAHTGHGIDISPEFHLSNIDERARSIAIIMDDYGTSNTGVQSLGNMEYTCHADYTGEYTTWQNS